MHLKQLNVNKNFSAPAAASIYGGMRQAGSCSSVQIQLLTASGALLAKETAAWVNSKTWKSILPPTAAGISFNITASCVNKAEQIVSSIMVADVAFGEVILCTGQVIMHCY